jgi:hypothetical protein
MAMVMGLTESTAQLAPGLGILLGGLITALATSRAAFAVAAGGSLLFAAAVPYVFRADAGSRADGPARAVELPDEVSVPRGKSLV